MKIQTTGESFRVIGQLSLPNDTIPTSLVAAAARLAGSPGLGKWYVEHQVTSPADAEADPTRKIGSDYRLYWLTDSTIGVVTGHSENEHWDGMRSLRDEHPHQITGSLRSSADLTEVLYVDTPIASFEQWEQTLEVESRVALVVGSEKVVVPKFPITIGGSTQRATLDAFIDGAIEIVAHRHA